MSKLLEQLEEMLKGANAREDLKEKILICEGQTIQLNVLDSDDLVIEVSGGAISVRKDNIENPTATVLGEEQAFIDLFNQELDPMGAVMSGKLVLKGNVDPLMDLELF